MSRGEVMCIMGTYVPVLGESSILDCAFIFWDVNLSPLLLGERRIDHPSFSNACGFTSNGQRHLHESGTTLNSEIGWESKVPERNSRFN